MRKRPGLERIETEIERLRSTVGAVELRFRFLNGEIVRIEAYTEPEVLMGRGTCWFVDAAKLDGSDDDAV